MREEDSNEETLSDECYGEEKMIEKNNSETGMLESKLLQGDCNNGRQDNIINKVGYDPT